MILHLLTYTSYSQTVVIVPGFGVYGGVVRLSNLASSALQKNQYFYSKKTNKKPIMTLDFDLS